MYCILYTVYCRPRGGPAGPGEGREVPGRSRGGLGGPGEVPGRFRGGPGEVREVPGSQGWSRVVGGEGMKFNDFVV